LCEQEHVYTIYEESGHLLGFDDGAKEKLALSGAFSPALYDIESLCSS
jgi:hypothetical protein